MVIEGKSFQPEFSENACFGLGELNLFEDVSIRFDNQHVRRDQNGRIKWIGWDKGTKASLEIFVGSDGTIHGTANLGDRRFYIQPVDSERHRIVEIRTFRDKLRESDL